MKNKIGNQLPELDRQRSAEMRAGGGGGEWEEWEGWRLMRKPVGEVRVTAVSMPPSASSA